MDAASSPPVAPPRRSPVLWIIAGLLALIAIGVWVRSPAPWLATAMAQNAPVAGARGVFAFTGPIDRDQYGLFMLDVDEGTIWCYAFENQSGTRKLRLVAARTWVYDRYLKDFNCAEPTFRDIQALVKQQRERTTSEDAGGANPGSGTAPRDK